MKQRLNKLLGLIVVAIFIFNVLPTIFQLGDMADNPSDIKKKEDRFPKAAAFQVYNMSVNGTNFSEDGIYYCFRNDTLNMKLETTNDVAQARMSIHSPTGNPIYHILDNQLINDLGGTTTKIFGYSLFISDSVQTGMYNGSLVFDSDPQKIFFFNLSVMNPQPRIIELNLTQQYFGMTTSQRVFEGDLIPVYKSANINITSYNVNDDGLAKIKSVVLIYQNASQTTWKTEALTKTINVTKGSYKATQYTLSSFVNIDIVKDWRVGTKYKFIITINDTEDSSSDFEFSILISNVPPKITSFSVEGASSQSTYMNAQRQSFIIKANGTDLESDAYFGETKYNFTYLATPSAANITTPGMTIVNGSLTRLYSNDNATHDFTNTYNQYGYQELGLSNKQLSDTSGLSYSSTYYFWCAIDGGILTQYTISTNSSDVTIGGVIYLMDQQLGAPAYVSLENGDIRVTSVTSGPTSKIELAKYSNPSQDLFSKLIGFYGFEQAVLGYNQGIYAANFTFSNDFNFQDKDLFNEWYINITFNVTTAFTGLNLQMFNYSSGSWETITGGTNILNGILAGTYLTKTFLNSELYRTHIGNFTNALNASNTFQIRLISSTRLALQIDSIQMFFKINRKVGFSDMILNVYQPASNIPIVLNMKNNYRMDWDNQGLNNQWAMNYTIMLGGDRSSIIGAWSFILKIYDFGSVSWEDIDPIDNQYGFSKLSSYTWNINDQSRSVAISTIIVNVGIAANNILEVKAVSANLTSAYINQDMNITVQMKDSLADRKWITLNETVKPDTDNMAVQPGDSGDNSYWDPFPSDGITIDYTNRSWFDSDRFTYKSNLILNGTDPRSTFENDSGSFQFRPMIGDFMRRWAIIVPFKLNTKYWLEPQNITRMWLTFTSNTMTEYAIESTQLFTAQAEVWDFAQQKWILPNETWGDTRVGPLNSIQNRFMKWDNRGFANESWFSGEWANKSSILNCIDTTRSNTIYIRLFYEVLESALPISLNMTYDFIQLTVEYNNSFTAKLYAFDTNDDTLQTWNLDQTNNITGFRNWSYVVQSHFISGRNIHFLVWAQNGNSSIWFDMGQLQGQRSGFYDGPFKWNPYYNSSNIINASFNLEIKKSSIILNVNNFATITNLNRNREPLQFNGTISWRYTIDNLTTFAVQLRQSAMTSMDEWLTIQGFNYLYPGTPDFLFWNAQTNTWNVSIVFKANTNFDWRSGVWYYRIITKSNETIVNATDWGVYRLHNYQPQNIEIVNFDNGSYYRVIDQVGYTIRFEDMESLNDTYSPYFGKDLNIRVLINVRNRDNNKAWERWDSRTSAKAIGITNGSIFTFSGGFNFSREVDTTNLDYYNEVFIRVEDTDIDWPQVGTMKFSDKRYYVLNNKPTSTGLVSDKANNEVYRNNSIAISALVQDIDDFPSAIRIQTFNLTYPTDYTGGTAVSNLSAQIFRSDQIWSHSYFVDRRNKTGNWVYQANFQDYDNDTLLGGMLTLTVKVLNNLPQLTWLEFVNEQTGQKGYTYNMSNFGVFRGNETIKMTAHVMDIEDTWISELGYQIQAVDFGLINNYKQELGFTDPSFVYTITRNGALGDSGLQNSRTKYYPVVFNASTYSTIRDTYYTPATQGTITTQGDNLYHNLNYTYNIPTANTRGGEVFYTFDGLPAFFDLHTATQSMNLSITYRMGTPEFIGPFSIYLYNRITNKWDLFGGTGVLSDTGGAWVSKNLTIEQSIIRNYLTELTGNILWMKINASADLPIGKNVAFQIDYLCLDYNKSVDNYYEIWTAEIKIPAVINSHAGEMKFNIRMKDQDNGLGTDTSNIFSVLNRPPVLVNGGIRVSVRNININPVSVTPNNVNGTRFEYCYGEYPIIEILINATDYDVFNDSEYIGIYYFVIEAQIKKGTSTDGWVRTILAEQISSESTYGKNTYYIKINFGEKTSKGEFRYPDLLDINEFRIIKITIGDYDAGYCDPAKFITSLEIDSTYKIIFTAKDCGKPPISIWVWIILGSVGGVSFVAWFYRRFISYRKYLSKED